MVLEDIGGMREAPVARSKKPVCRSYYDGRTLVNRVVKVNNSRVNEVFRNFLDALRGVNGFLTLTASSAREPFKGVGKSPSVLRALGHK